MSNAPPTKMFGPMESALGGSVGQSMFGGDNRRAAQASVGYQHFRHWVYIAVSCIAKRLAGQPICAGFNPNAPEQEENQERSYRSHKATAIDRLRMPLKSTYDDPDFEMLTDHPALFSFERPNPLQHKFEFLFTWVANLLLTGEAYWIGGEAEDGLIEVWAVPSKWIIPKHEDGVFTGYELKVSSDGEGEPLPPENVARTYLPDPADLKGCVSPIMTQISAIRTDDHIQTSQEDAFKRGIFPNVAIKVGQTLDENGKPTGARPTLEGPQRRQLIRAVRQVWDRTVGQGDPAILDGLIEDVYQLHNTPREMDWMKSAEQVKSRVLGAFNLHPFMVGAELGVGGYAQAAIIEQIAADLAFNPIAEAFSAAATDFAAPMYPEPKGLQIWLAPVRPRNEEMRAREWEFGRRNEDVTRDEWRAERLGLPPSEVKKKARLLETVGGLTGSVQVLQAVGEGTIAAESAKKLFTLSFDLEEKDAQELVDPTAVLPKPEAPIPGKPVSESPDDDEDDPTEVYEEEEEESEPGKSLIVKSASGPTLSRGAIKDAHVKKLTAAERGVASAMARFFRDTNQSDREEPEGPGHTNHG